MEEISEMQTFFAALFLASLTAIILFMFVMTVYWLIMSFKEDEGFHLFELWEYLSPYEDPMEGFCFIYYAMFGIFSIVGIFSVILLEFVKLL